jgi:hypothetical protein
MGHLTAAKADKWSVHYNNSYQPWITDAANKYLGGDQAALISMISVESSWNPNATYQGHATGLGQFEPGTAGSYPEFVGGDDKHGTVWPSGTVYNPSTGHPDDARFDPKRSIYASAHLLSGMIGKYGDLETAYEKGYHTYTNAQQEADAKTAGAKLMKTYGDLKNGGGCIATEPTAPIPAGSCSNILTKAQSYFGIDYNEANPHCGNLNTSGPSNVKWLDCSGFTSRSYHDAGVSPASGWCVTTPTIPNTSFLKQIANNVTSAKQLNQPGDMILMNGHVVMFGGLNSKGVPIVYESSTYGTGPHQKAYDIYKYAFGRGFKGLYRSKSCM